MHGLKVVIGKQRHLTRAEIEAWCAENLEKYRTIDHTPNKPRTGGVADPQVREWEGGTKVEPLWHIWKHRPPKVQR